MITIFLEGFEDRKERRLKLMRVREYSKGSNESYIKTDMLLETRLPPLFK